MADIPPEGLALLETIAGSESAGDYGVIYGGSQVSSYADHPRVNVVIKSGPNKGKTSSAAGKYQFLGSTWDDAKDALGLKDFSPASQDRAAWWLAQRDYRDRTNGGDLLTALRSGKPSILANVAKKLAPTWTSLPGGIEQGQSGRAFRTAYATAFALLAPDAGKTNVPLWEQRAQRQIIQSQAPSVIPTRRPDTVGGKEIKPLVAPAPLTFGTASKPPVQGLKLPVAPGNPARDAAIAARQAKSAAVKPAVQASGKTIAQIGQEADNARLSGYRDIAAMGPSSKGAKPTAVATPAKKPGVIKTTAPAQEIIPHDVVPGTIKAVGGGTGSALTTPGAGLASVPKGVVLNTPSRDSVAIRANAQAVLARQAKAQASAMAAQEAARRAQANAAANAAAAAAAMKARATAAWNAQQAIVAAKVSAPKISEVGGGGAYTTNSYQQDRFQTLPGQLMPAATNTPRWTGP